MVAKARRADRRRDRRDRPLPARTRQAVRRNGADAALGARAIRRPERQPDHGVHRPRGDLQGLAGVRARSPASTRCSSCRCFTSAPRSSAAKFLPIIAKGGVVTAIAISEPQAGSDVTRDQHPRRKDGDSYVLNGRKQWCSYGVAADYIVVMARTGDGPGADGISAFIVEPKTDGRHHLRTPRAQDGLSRRAEHADLLRQCARFPQRTWSERKARDFRASMRALDLNRPTIGAQSVGLAQGALDASRRLRQGAQAVQEGDLGIPGRAVHARRHGDADRGRARPRL